jgi:hypothetical protein
MTDTLRKKLEADLELAEKEITVPFFWMIDLDCFQVFHTYADTSAKMNVRGETELLDVINEKFNESFAGWRKQNAAITRALLLAIEALEVIKSYGHLSEPEDRNKLVKHTVKLASEYLAAIEKEVMG